MNKSKLKMKKKEFTATAALWEKPIGNVRKASPISRSIDTADSVEHQETFMANTLTQ